MGRFTLDATQQETPTGEVEVVVVRGDLDAHTFPKLQERLEASLVAGRPRIVLDCSGLDYISSAGLGVLKQMCRDCRESGGDIRLAGLSEKVRSIMSLLGFTRLLHVYPHPSDAVASFR